jgi:hypothetical protein
MLLDTANTPVTSETFGMQTPVFVLLISTIVIFIGYLVIPRINRGIAAKEAAKGRVREFHGFVTAFKARMFAARLPDDWVPYLVQTAPELRSRFESVAPDMSESDRLRWKNQIETVLTFSKMQFAEIYQREQEFNTAISQLGDLPRHRADCERDGPRCHSTRHSG